MSMPMRVMCKCSVCQTESQQTILASTNRFGAPDLDLRPPEMMRSTMRWWIQECPKCGYVSASLDEPATVNEAWLSGEAYRSCDGCSFESPLAARFYKHYLVCRQSGDVNGAFHALLRAAWACDDRDDTANAVHCRRLAIEQCERLLAQRGGDETLQVQKADLLRRAGLFASLQEEYKNVQMSDELLNKIVAFQLEKAAQKDTACYTVRAVAGDPLG